MLVKSYWAARDDNGYVLYQRALMQPEQITLPPEGMPRPVLLSQPLNLGLVTAMAKYRIVDEIPLLELVSLDAAKAYAIPQIDVLCEAARLAVLGDSTRITDHARAKEDAIAFRDAGFAGDVPRGVAGWLHAKRREIPQWTAQVAAEDILAAANSQDEILYGIRDLRLDSKELIRDATSTFEAEVIFDTFVETLATLLGN